MEVYTKKQRQNIQAVASGLLLIIFVGVFFISKSMISSRENDDEFVLEDTGSEEKQNKISAADLNRKMNLMEKVLIVDVRSSEEYTAKHIRGSRSYPIENLASLTTEAGIPVIIVTKKNDKAIEEIASNILKEKGINFVILDKGFESWSLAGYPTFSEGNPRDFIDQSKVTFITAETLAPLLADNSYLIIDVQKPEAFAQKHIDTAINIPLDEIEKRAGEIPPSRKIIVYGSNELESFRGAVRLFDLNVFGAETLRGNEFLKPGSPLPLKP
jgi:rhodanese-related sulfurtransferase